MISFTAEEMGDILNTARIGLWRMEIEDGVVKRLFTDSRMDEIMGKRNTQRLAALYRH